MGDGNPPQYSCLENSLDARGEGERVLALESREGTRALRRVEEGLSRSLSGLGKNTWVPSTCAGDVSLTSNTFLKKKKILHTS